MLIRDLEKFYAVSIQARLKLTRDLQNQKHLHCKELPVNFANVLKG